MKRSIAVTTLALALTIGSTAHAWKPVMHVTLADAVLDELRNSPSGLDLDAVANFQNQTSGGTLGTFELDALVRQAVLTHPDQFRAGVLGPDAFPDLITGQSIIHPHDETGPGPGADDWLRRLWQAAYSEAQTTGHDEPLAFVAGFLVHAAGDMFAHTFVNHYADGPFDITTDNAQRHIIVEGYVAKHIPDPASSSISITGVERDRGRQQGLPGQELQGPDRPHGARLSTGVAARHHPRPAPPPRRERPTRQRGDVEPGRTGQAVRVAVCGKPVHATEPASMRPRLAPLGPLGDWRTQMCGLQAKALTAQPMTGRPIMGVWTLTLDGVTADQAARLHAVDLDGWRHDPDPMTGAGGFDDLTPFSNLNQDVQAVDVTFIVGLETLRYGAQTGYATVPAP